MANLHFGYVRYASSDVELQQQIDVINPFIDCAAVVVRGKLKSLREHDELHELIERMSNGDSLVVAGIDRVVRPVLELPLLLKKLRSRGLELKYVVEDTLRTCPPTDDISDLMRFEKLYRDEQIFLGRRRAAERGSLGRRRTFDYSEASKMYERGATIDELAVKYEVSTRTIRRALCSSTTSAREPKSELD